MIYALWHIKVSLRDDLKFKDDIPQDVVLSFIFSKENISQAKPISHTDRCIS